MANKEMKVEMPKAQPQGVQLTGEDLGRILNSLKQENQELKNRLAEATGILTKLAILDRIVKTREGVFAEDYVKGCAEKIVSLTDEFIKL